MGYSTLLDILGSMFIGGVLLLTLNQVNQNTVTNAQFYSGDMLMQRDLLQIVEIVESDFKRIGYTANPALIPTPTDAILAADSSSFRFKGDVNADGNLDSLEYYLGSTYELRETQNPRDRFLYRKWNTDNPMRIARVTQFLLKYYNALGDSIDLPILPTETGEISLIQISVQIESPEEINSEYAKVYWRQVRLAAKNLRNR